MIDTTIYFVSHPYHRGGVTSWCIDALNHLQAAGKASRLISVCPKRAFISGKQRPLILDLLSGEINRKAELPQVGFFYELGTSDYRAHVLAQTIKRLVPIGSALIPSDDEASWKACSMVADSYKFLGVVHSDDKAHYDVYERYRPYLSGVVTISNRIHRKLSLTDKPVIVSPCGIVLPKWKIKERKYNKIVFVGRLDEEQKRVSDLIPLIEIVKKFIPDAKLEIWGHGGSFGSMYQTIQKKELRETVSLKGWGTREEILRSLSESKVLLQVSNYEGMSIAVMEALAMGCMVVSSEVSGVEDYARVKNGAKVIHLFPVGDLTAACSQIRRAILSYDEKKSTSARAFAEKYFSIQTCMEKYEQFASKLSLQHDSKILPEPSLFERLKSKIYATLRFANYHLKFCLRCVG